MNVYYELDTRLKIDIKVEISPVLLFKKLFLNVFNVEASTRVFIAYDVMKCFTCNIARLINAQILKLFAN